MNQTKNLKKPADMNGMERVKARKDLRHYPVPDYLKDLGVSSMADLTEEIPLVYHCDNPFFQEDKGYPIREAPEELCRETLAGSLGQICRVKLGNSAHPLQIGRASCRERV